MADPAFRPALALAAPGAVRRGDVRRPHHAAGHRERVHRPSRPAGGRPAPAHRRDHPGLQRGGGHRGHPGGHRRGRRPLRRAGPGDPDERRVVRRHPGAGPGHHGRLPPRHRRGPRRPPRRQVRVPQRRAGPHPDRPGGAHRRRHHHRRVVALLHAPLVRGPGDRPGRAHVLPPGRAPLGLPPPAALRGAEAVRPQPQDHPDGRRGERGARGVHRLPASSWPSTSAGSPSG